MLIRAAIEAFVPARHIGQTSFVLFRIVLLDPFKLLSPSLDKLTLRIVKLEDSCTCLNVIMLNQ